MQASRHAGKQTCKNAVKQAFRQEDAQASTHALKQTCRMQANRHAGKQICRHTDKNTFKMHAYSHKAKIHIIKQYIRTYRMPAGRHKRGTLRLTD
jgi:hypothetical protein